MESELLRDLLGVVAHDLGGLSSALALRADALEERLTPEERSALRAIAEDARALGRQVRQLRGPRGTGALAPDRPGSLLAWWRLVDRFGRGTLRRGVTLEAEIDDLNIGVDQAHALALAVLALFRHLADDPSSPATALRVSATASPGGIDVHVAAVGPSGERLVPPDHGPWQLCACEVANRSSITIEATQGMLVLRVPRVNP